MKEITTEKKIKQEKRTSLILFLSTLTFAVLTHLAIEEQSLLAPVTLFLAILTGYIGTLHAEDIKYDLIRSQEITKLLAQAEDELAIPERTSQEKSVFVKNFLSSH